MRNTLLASSFVFFTAVGCESGPGMAKEPPVLAVTSPIRSMVQGQAGRITVTGTAAPAARGGAAVTKVMVNNVEATLGADGSFTAAIDVAQGATLLETVATGADGASATDTRAIQAGQLRPVGTSIDRAITAALSADTFARISAAAGPLVKSVDMPALLAPLQPMVSLGDSLGNLKLSVTDLKLSDIKISLAPVAGGLSFSAEIDGLDVPARVDFAGTLVPDGSTTVDLVADQVTVSGTLDVTPAGMSGFTTVLVDPMVHTTGLRLVAPGLTGTILDLLNSALGSAIQTVVSKGAELAMGPLVNQALGALGGPQQLDLFGKKLDLQVAPSAVAFTATGAVVAMNLKAMLEGSEASPGFIYTDNGSPTMDAAQGFQLGLADDLVNELLAELHALGVLNLSMPQSAGMFDTAQIQLTMPPMISAASSDGQGGGQMQLVLGDMFATFVNRGTPVAKAAINARVALKIAPAANGAAVALQLGTPEIKVNMLDDVANTTGLAGDDLAAATSAVLGAQIDSVTKLLVAIPVPSLAGLQLSNLSIGADDGYVMVSGELQ